MGSRSTSRRGGQPPKRVCVARRVETQQPAVRDFLDKVGLRLGCMGVSHAITSTHLTFLESAGVRRKFSNLGYTPEDVRTFSGALKQFLSQEQTDGDATVWVDGDEPFVWKGRSRDKLALNVVPDGGLLEERRLIEEFLRTQFGEVPRMRPFEPHITIGQVNRVEVGPEARSNPSLLLPEGVRAPGEVTLNGLMVYLNNIGEK